MSEVLDFMRSKSPALKSVDDDTLTRFVGDKYPDLLDKEPALYDRWQSLVGEQGVPPEDLAKVEKTADLLAEKRKAEHEGAYQEGVISRINTLTGNVAEPLTRPVSGVYGKFLDAAVMLANPGLKDFHGAEEALKQPLVRTGRLPQAKTETGQIASGSANSILGFVEGFSQPDMLAQLPGGVNRLVLAGWAALMAKEVPGQLNEAVDKWKAGDKQGAAEAATTGVGGTILSGLLTFHAIPKSPIEQVAPQTAKAVATVMEPTPELKPGDVLPETSLAPLTAEATKGTTPNALHEETTSVLQPVRPQPIEGQGQVPAAPRIEETGVGGEPAPAPTPGETPSGVEAKPVGPKWTSATEQQGGQMLMGIPDPIATAKAVAQLYREAKPAVKRAYENIKEWGKEAATEAFKAPNMGDYRKSVLNWSAKLQRSFGEAASAQAEIKKAVPDEVRQEGITNWLEAGGDPAVLKERLDATTDPKLRPGYEAALHLTPEELAVANDVRPAFDALGNRGQTYDVLKDFRENYVTHLWDLGRGPAGAGGSRTLKQNFRYAKARTFDSFFEGEQAGYTPKTKAIGKILPVYIHEMNSVIAARQLVEEMSHGTASTGEPLVVPRGTGTVVDNPRGKAYLIMPKAIKGDTSQYKTIPNQPALTDWRWATKDEAGNPIFLKSDLAIHPEAYAKLKAVLGKSAIKEWYESKTTALAAIPKALVKGIDRFQSETKRTMLGVLAPFHQVQEGTHAVGHRVNPFFNIPKIDLVNDAGQMDAARHGLMLLPDRASEHNFMEGFKTSGLVSKIPGLGPVADWYSNYLFHQYIPGLKYKTYEAILDRNRKVYAKDLASGEVKESDVKLLSSEQANAAYGHLNYADISRDPTIQHILRTVLLAPDFLEARGRFTAQAIKGVTGGKAGREQLLALGTLAIGQATAAYVTAQLIDGEWEGTHPFEVRKDDRRYSLRSVPEDTAALMNDSRRFVYNRLSPIVGKGAIQGLSGVDWAGHKVTPAETAKELAVSPVPLSMRGFLGTSKSSLSVWEQLAGSVGLRISPVANEKAVAAAQLNEMADKWMREAPRTSPGEKAMYLRQQLLTLSGPDRQQALKHIRQHSPKPARDLLKDMK